MKEITQNVDAYLINGCGRCKLYKTPQCKVHTWTEELRQLRSIVLNCGLKEELKWSQPCYTLQDGNVLLVTAFKAFATIAFFKGTLLKDKHKTLVAPGENSQAVRQFRFTNLDEIIRQEAIIKSYVMEAIYIEKKGLKVSFEKNADSIPEELEMKFVEDPMLKTAFEALTPGRQRGYILHFSQPKQSKTRSERIEKCKEKILIGEGFNDGYKSMGKK